MGVLATVIQDDGGPVPVLQRFEVRLEHDEFGPGFADYLGRFTDDVESADLCRGSAFKRLRVIGRNEYEFFECAYTVEARRADLSALGYSRGVSEYMARAQCREDWARAEKYGDDWWYLIASVSAVVSVTVGGVEFSTTFEAGPVGGIESDSSADHFKRTLFDLGAECVGQIDKAFPAPGGVRLGVWRAALNSAISDELDRAHYEGLIY